jgi:hypothetical protein
LFISQVIYENGELWWNDIDREKFMIGPPALSGNPISRASSGAKQEELAKDMMDFALRSISFILQRVL